MTDTSEEPRRGRTGAQWGVVTLVIALTCAAGLYPVT